MSHVKDGRDAGANLFEFSISIAFDILKSRALQDSPEINHALETVHSALLRTVSRMRSVPLRRTGGQSAFFRLQAPFHR